MVLLFQSIPLLQSSSSGVDPVCIFAIIIIIIMAIVVASNQNRNTQATKNTIQSLSAVDSVTVGKCITGFANLNEMVDGIMTCAITENDFVFVRETGTELDRIPRDAINQILVEDKSKITQHITVRRVLALGVFALAAPKTTKVPSFYLLFDWNRDDGTQENTVFEFSTPDSNVRANKAITTLRQYIKPKIERLKANEKKCPYCAETIKKEATVCRFCGRDLPMPN